MDPAANLSDSSSDDTSALSVSRHFVAYGYDAAGDVALTWDRLATQQKGRAASAYTAPTESNGAPTVTLTGAPDGFTQTLYGDSATVMGHDDLFQVPGRYLISTTRPAGINISDAPTEPSTAPSVTKYTLDANGNRVAAQSPRGKTTHYGYDGDDELITVTLPIGSSDMSRAGTTTYGYDGNGNRWKTIDARGTTNYTIFNFLDEPSIQIRPRVADASKVDTSKCPQGVLGLDTTTYDCYSADAYDGLGQLVLHTAPNGATTHLFYDAAGRLILRSVPFGARTSQAGQRALAGNPANPVPLVAYLNTAQVLDADGNTLRTCRPRDFDQISGNLNGDTGQPGTGGGLPTNTSSYISNCTSKVPQYGSKQIYDPADKLTTTVAYRTFGAGVADPAVSTYNAVTELAQGSATTALVTTDSYDADGNHLSELDPPGNADVEPNGGATPVPTTTTFDILDRTVCRSVFRDTNSTLPPVPAACAQTSSTHTVSTVTSYDDSGDVTSVTAPAADATSQATGTTLSRITDSVYDLNHRLVQTIAAATSSDASTLTGTTSASGPQQNLRTGYRYDEDGNVTQRFDPRAYTGSVSSPDTDYSVGIVYDDDDRAVSVYAPRWDNASPPAGDQTTQCPTTVRPPTASPVTVNFSSTTVGICVTGYKYDEDSNRTVVVLPSQTGVGTAREIDTAYTLDNLTDNVKAPDPKTGSLGIEQQLTYDPDGNVASDADLNGRTTTTAYSYNDLPLSSATTGSEAHQNVYDAAGNVITSADRTGTISWQTSATSDWQATAKVFNSDNTIASSTDTTLDMPASAADTTSYAYNLNGDATTITSPNGNATTQTYTDDELLASVSKPVSTITTPTTTTNAKRVTNYGYDPAGRKETQSVSTVTTVTDPQGKNPPTTTTGDGGTQTFAYYPNDKAASETGRSAPSNTTKPGSTVGWGYDAAGNTTSVSDNTYSGGPPYGSSTTATYYLDSLLNTTTETANYMHTLTYDGIGALATDVSTQNGYTQTITATNNDAGLVKTLKTDQSGLPSWQFTYNDIGETASIQYPNNQRLNNTYNPSDTLAISDLQNSSGSSLAKYTYSYDNDERVTKQTRAGSTVSGVANQNGDYTYVYDSNGRLCQFNDIASIRNADYDHDSNRTDYGNAAAESNCYGSVTATASSNKHYGYNKDDTLSSDTATSTVQYDNAGRLLNDGSNRYCYDGLDRTQVIAPAAQTDCSLTSAGVTTYTYDGLDRQLSATPSATSNQTTHTYGYQGLADTKVSDTTSGTGSTTPIYYINSPDGTPLSIGYNTSSGTIQQNLSDDGQGNISSVTNSSQTVICTKRYDPFGTEEPSNACSSTYLGTLAYRSNSADPTSHTYQDGARTYNPSLDAFTTPWKSPETVEACTMRSSHARETTEVRRGVS